MGSRVLINGTWYYAMDSIDGSEVHKYFREGRIQDIANYCETDIVDTYRVWLRCSVTGRFLQRLN